ncbi:MAG: methylisocitrate lyase [Chloroflexi bacterium]|nr:methylisocitrate lyase [Chloroflexota bacterium]
MTWMLEREPAQNHAVKLRETLDAGETVVAPGVFNPLTAMIARKVGFDALYFSGAAFSASLGIPDIGLFTLAELTDSVRWMTRASGLPFIVDADTGFGEAINVIRTVRELELAGAAAVQIEDQVLPKRCGHLDGKTVVSTDEFVEKIAAAAQARENMLIIARTDVRAIEGMEAAIERGQLCKEAGADIIFPEAMQSPDEFRMYADAVGGSLLANMTEFGKSPYLTANEFAALGYNIVIFPVSTLRAAAKTTEALLTDLKRHGTLVDWLPQMQTRAELYDLIEYDAYAEADSAIALTGDRGYMSGRG